VLAERNFITGEGSRTAAVRFFDWVVLGRHKGRILVKRVVDLTNFGNLLNLVTYLLNLLTPRSRVLLEKLIGLQLVKIFPTFYEIRRFITAITSARHLSTS
jgi:hypothetical protein